MREYKFRAWDKENKVMCDVSHIFIANMVLPQTVMASVGSEMKHCPSDAILMQFTGLHDKNGKEIFEGDILKSEGETKTQPFNFNKEVRDPWWEISEVVFEGGRFGQIVRTQHNSYFGELPSPFRDIFRPEEYKEVIGNIYEHPELLKDR